MRARDAAAAFLVVSLSVTSASALRPPAAAPSEPVALAPAEVAALRAHIERTWPVLTRSLDDVARAAEDPKLGSPPDGRWPVYVAGGESLEAVSKELESRLPPADFARLSLRRLPAASERGAGFLHGLLYLPRPYVVPGRPLQRDVRLGQLLHRARPAARRRRRWRATWSTTSVYEVEHYGTVLNANRTYYLTRSQPPLLTAMVARRLSGEPATASGCAARCRRSRRTTRTGRSRPHLLPALGLVALLRRRGGARARSGRRRARRARPHSLRPRARVVSDARDVADYDMERFYDAGSRPADAALLQGRPLDARVGIRPHGTASARSAPTSPTYVPVCLNALLYQMERDLAEIDEILGRRRACACLGADSCAVDAEPHRPLLWDDARGLYLDYDFAHAATPRIPVRDDVLLRSGSAPPRPRRPTASARQLPRLETRWRAAHEHDAVGSAVGRAVRLGAAAALRRRRACGATATTRPRVVWRVGFVGLVAGEFERTRHDRREVRRRARRLRRRRQACAFGYTSNEVGFGWTNGVVLELLADLETPSLH